MSKRAVLLTRLLLLCGAVGVVLVWSAHGHWSYVGDVLVLTCGVGTYVVVSRDRNRRRRKSN